MAIGLASPDPYIWAKTLHMSDALGQKPATGWQQRTTDMIGPTHDNSRGQRVPVCATRTPVLSLTQNKVEGEPFRGHTICRETRGYLGGTLGCLYRDWAGI